MDRKFSYVDRKFSYINRKTSYVDRKFSYVKRKISAAKRLAFASKRIISAAMRKIYFAMMKIYAVKRQTSAAQRSRLPCREILALFDDYVLSIKNHSQFLIFFYTPLHQIRFVFFSWPGNILPVLLLGYFHLRTWISSQRIWRKYCFLFSLEVLYVNVGSLMDPVFTSISLSPVRYSNASSRPSALNGI